MSYANFSVSLASASWLDDPNVVSNDPDNDDVSADNSCVHDMRYIFGSGSSYDDREGTLYMTLLSTMDTDSSSDDDSTSVSTDYDSDDSDDDSDDSFVQENNYIFGSFDECEDSSSEWEPDEEDSVVSTKKHVTI